MRLQNGKEYRHIYYRKTAPVRLAEVKLVFSIGALTFEGDLPASIFHMQLIENDIADWAPGPK